MFNFKSLLGFQSLSDENKGAFKLLSELRGCPLEMFRAQVRVLIGQIDLVLTQIYIT